MARSKRATGASLFALAALTAAAGCSPSEGSGDEGEDTVLTFMHRYPEEAYSPYFQSVVEAFEDANPGVTVDVTEIGNDTYRQQLTLLTGQGKLPDVFWATPGNLEREFVDAGLALELGDALEEDGWGDSFDQVTLASYQMEDGGIYGIPLQSNYKFMAYNPSLLEENKIEFPQTFEDLLKACDDLRANGVTPIAFGNAEGWPAAHYMTVLNGYYVPADVREADYNSTEKPAPWADEGYSNALDAFGALNERCFPSGSATATFDTARASFLSGKAAMYSGSFGEVKLISDEVDADAFPQPWAIANIPAPVDARGDTDSVAGAGNGVMIKDGENKDLAVKFVRFMTNQQNAEAFPEETGFVSAVSSANTDENTIDQTAVFLEEIVANASAVNMWLDNALPGKVEQAYSSALEGYLSGSLTANGVLDALRSTAP